MQSGGDLPGEEADPGQVRAHVDRPRRVAPLLHVRDHARRERPDNDECRAGVQVRSGEEIPREGVRVERSLPMG